ncbi:MAG TPA: ABC transporter substrate-binding protein [Acetobacteraceae bacterium]|jgi:phospholipid transport system substrate-binding protein|nr:ABC transporter substrate-binding protein [Acetobacteraceae bacterium]
MPSRRFLLTVSAAWLAIGHGARAQSATDGASAFVKATGDKLVAVVNGPGSSQQKRQMLTQIIDGTVDVDGVARFCLGRFWKQASPDQQKRYIMIFHQVLVTNITSKLGEYQGVKFTMGRTEPDGDNAKVSTVVDRPNSPPTNVQWIISSPASDPKIVDVVAEGTSLRLTQRSDYASYLSHNNNNIDALIGAMQQQVEQAHASG